MTNAPPTLFRLAHLPTSYSMRFSRSSPAHTLPVQRRLPITRASILHSTLWTMHTRAPTRPRMYLHERFFGFFLFFA